MASQKQLKKVLRQLMNQPDNAVCVDCNDKRPTWASILVPPPGSPFTDPIGCFVCYHCSGAHRRMGTHICFVRSTNLDEWKEKEVIAMKRGGNKVINSMFEATLQNTIDKPDKNTELEPRSEFIYQKYQHRTWYDGSKSIVNASSRKSVGLSPPKSNSAGFQSDPFANQENLFAAKNAAPTPQDDNDPFADFGSGEFTSFANFDAFNNGNANGTDECTPRSPDIFGEFSAKSRTSLISSLESKEFKSNVLEDIAHLDIGADPMSPTPKPKRISLKHKKRNGKPKRRSSRD